ncbi:MULTISPECIES: TetR/AcrR family transcriptional regulator [unclassified Streptomyces]|uniref:TetR/AcrR family transcriptional regulator n=1 Tax=unclassified Streptomyces TaxID=2593676 RepID=UPI000B89EE32|nr:MULTISPECIES: TetR/AcrR family transcriptional regulator [unclassified Streptomyces]MYZ36114.1 TetR family transcriptional regulator [Streptomyces sp. SID4917]
MEPADGLRRAPVQQRSTERLARILDACAELLDEMGYEQLSTRAVAARAGVPIGSVYRFFGNKRAMADALARRNLDSYAESVGERLAPLDARDWHGAIDAVLDEYLAMRRTVPGFALVDFGAQLPLGTRAAARDPAADAASGSADPADPDSDPGLRVVGRLTGLLAAHLGRAPTEALHRTVLVAVEATDALLQLAFRTDPAGDPAIVAETRELLRAYLARTLDRGDG